VDGNDVFAVHDAAREAVAHLRRGDGPFFLECTTYRWREHVGPLWDHDKGYRTKAEVDSWVARCPIRRASERLVGEGACTPAAITAMERASQAEVDEAVVAARAASFPAVEDLTTGAY
jgi:pyruvate dehydrogenase E1 component alpha subunit